MTLKIPYLIAISIAATIIFHLASPPGLSAAPVVTLESLDGQRFDLAKSAGKTRLVSFFSPDCPISKRDVATLNAVHHQSTSEVEVIAVSMPYDSSHAVKEFEKSSEIDYAVSLDTDGEISRAFPEVRFTPTTFLIDSEGEIIWRHTGRLMPKNLNREIANAIQTLSVE